jgi:hypothetical protein
MPAKFVHFNGGSHGYVLQFWSQERMPCIRLRHPSLLEGKTDAEMDEMMESGELFYREEPESNQTFLW